MTEEKRVDVSAIEHQLAELWRAERGGDGVVKAALWNVVAHTWTSESFDQATEVLAAASAAVPQRTIIVQSDPKGQPDIASWISANCHLIGGGGHQVCSEEVSIIASGDHVDHIPPLVAALLLPDMPVAVWWIGDLPQDHLRYSEALLDPADRLIVDSSQFDSPDDFAMIARIGADTTTAPADLNWARLEEWRAATAATFDPPSMRRRLQSIAHVRIVSGGPDTYGGRTQAHLYAAWLKAQSGSRFEMTIEMNGDDPGIALVELQFDDGTRASVKRNAEHRVVIGAVEGADAPVDCIARSLAAGLNDLIVRLLKRPETDRVYLKALAAMQPQTE